MHFDISLSDTSFLMGDDISLKVKVVNYSGQNQLLVEEVDLAIAKWEGDSENVFMKTKIQLKRLPPPWERKGFWHCTGGDKRPVQRLTEEDKEAIKMRQLGFRTMKHSGSDSIGFKQSLSSFKFSEEQKTLFYDFDPELGHRFQNVLLPGKYRLYLTFVAGKRKNKMYEKLTFRVRGIPMEDEKMFEDYVSCLRYHQNWKKGQGTPIFNREDPSVEWYAQKYPQSPYLKSLFDFVFVQGPRTHVQNLYLQWLLLEQLKARSFPFSISKNSYLVAFLSLCSMEEYHFVADADLYLKEWLIETKVNNPEGYQLMQESIQSQKGQ